MTHVLLVITIRKRDGGYDVVYSYDDAPMHRMHGAFLTLEAAKTSVSEPVVWHDPEPDAVAAGAVAVASIAAK